MRASVAPAPQHSILDKTNHMGYMPRRDGSWGVSASPLRPGARSALSKDGGVRIRGTNGGACYLRRGIGPQARKVVRQEREPAPVPACPSGSSEFGPSTRHFRHSHKPASRTQTSADRSRPRLPHLPAALTGFATRPRPVREFRARVFLCPERPVTPTQPSPERGRAFLWAEGRSLRDGFAPLPGGEGLGVGVRRCRKNGAGVSPRLRPCPALRRSRACPATIAGR